MSVKRKVRMSVLLPGSTATLLVLWGTTHIILPRGAAFPRSASRPSMMELESGIEPCDGLVARQTHAISNRRICNER